MQSNQNTGGKHKKFPRKSNEFDKLTLKTMTTFPDLCIILFTNVKSALRLGHRKPKFKIIVQKRFLTMFVPTV